jgi:hypothetical protein
MGPLAVGFLRRCPNLMMVVSVVLAGGVGCQGRGGPEMTDVDRRFPLPAETDLVVRLAPEAPRPEVRRITADLILLDGVAATEAHYDALEIRVVVSRDMSAENRLRLRSRLLDMPEVVAVTLRPPEE